MGISILVPTLGNVNYLELFCRSVEQNTTVPFEILIWNNENITAVEDFCKSKGYRHFYSDVNLGITKPYNVMVRNAHYDLIFLADDDYYCLPGWDSITQGVEDVYWKRPALIDPRDYMSIRSILGKYGYDEFTFAEAALLSDFNGKFVPDTLGTHMPPVMKKQDYIEIGGFNEDFYVGETDFLWRAFCYYQMNEWKQVICGTSFIYHFGSKTQKPFSGRADNMKCNEYLIETYAMDEKQLGIIMGIQ